jgi:aldose 1-epimerase
MHKAAKPALVMFNPSIFRRDEMLALGSRERRIEIGKTKGAAIAMTLMALASGHSSARAGEVQAAQYGTTQDGRVVTAYTLINDTGASATILDFGGTISEIRVPDREGRLGNVVMSFADLTGWEAVGHANANIGRYSNRIRGGFMLDGVHYPLQQNASGITLHGGPPPYSTRIWTAAPIQLQDGAAVTLWLESPAGDQGFPGTLRISATYRLTDDNALRLDFGATTDRPTVLNLTNHIYFNLNGNSTSSVYGHRITLAADRVAVKDSIGILTGELKPVQGTALDASSAIPVIQLVASAADPAFAAPRSPANTPTPGQLRNFDHSYAFPCDRNRLDRVSARLEDDDSGRIMELRTTEPSVQVYVPGNRAGSATPTGHSGSARRSRSRPNICPTAPTSRTFRRPCFARARPSVQQRSLTSTRSLPDPRSVRRINRRPRGSRSADRRLAVGG